MDALVIAAASGMKARMESLDMLANNLANQNSPGYKTDREQYSTYLAEEAVTASDESALPTSPVSPVIERHWTDFSQGSLVATGNSLDLALEGPGFFRAAGPAGPLYTRSGHFHLSPQGALQTQEGYEVLGDDGRNIKLDPRQNIEVNRAGEILQGGSKVARLGLASFRGLAELSKQSGTYFQAPEGAAATPANPMVHQARLEASNQPPAEAAVRLITVLRQFEMLQRAIQLGAEMNRRADDVARLVA